ncbi:MAG: hypothetical protein HY842_14685 [Bacteroidetes bacterium]|nr:hypothetical protein [Bacteroidota bacterium]
MTLVLNFSDNTSLQQLKQLAEWLKGTGLIKSFKIALAAPEESDTDTFVEEMLMDAEADIAAGRTYTSDEAKNVAAHAVLPRLDRTKFKAQTFQQADYQLDFWLEKVPVERLSAAAYLNSMAWGFDLQAPPKMDKHIFSTRQHAC